MHEAQVIPRPIVTNNQSADIFADLGVGISIAT
jgi:hypothetical protein